MLLDSSWLYIIFERAVTVLFSAFCSHARPPPCSGSSSRPGLPAGAGVAANKCGGLAGAVCVRAAAATGKICFLGGGD